MGVGAGVGVGVGAGVGVGVRGWRGRRGRCGCRRRGRCGRRGRRWSRSLRHDVVDRRVLLNHYQRSWIAADYLPGGNRWVELIAADTCLEPGRGQGAACVVLRHAHQIRDGDRRLSLQDGDVDRVALVHLGAGGRALFHDRPVGLGRVVGLGRNVEGEASLLRVLLGLVERLAHQVGGVHDVACAVLGREEQHHDQGDDHDEQDRQDARDPGPRAGAGRFELLIGFGHLGSASGPACRFGSVSVRLVQS